MLDFNNYLSGEIRHLAFRKSNEQGTWQEAVKQSRRSDIENRLRSLAKDNLIAEMADTLSFRFRQWRRKHHQATPRMTGLPSHHGSD